MIQPDEPLALRPREAARMLNVSQRTLYNWTKQGVVPHLRIGSGKKKCVLYPVDELRAWLRQAVKQATQEDRGAGQ